MTLTRRELARLLTRVENGQADDELAALYPQTGRAHIIGLTGAPGTGKSSLVSALTQHYRSQGLTVAIIAVDPTSPFSGGAILGDRIRMRDLSGDAGVFIRSMATRGALGGLAVTTTDMIRVLDAAGFDIVLVETVGAGQSEVDIAGAAQTTLVLECPAQAMIFRRSKRASSKLRIFWSSTKPIAQGLKVPSKHYAPCSISAIAPNRSYIIRCAWRVSTVPDHTIKPRPSK